MYVDLPAIEECNRIYEENGLTVSDAQPDRRILNRAHRLPLPRERRQSAKRLFASSREEESPRLASRACVRLRVHSGLRRFCADQKSPFRELGARIEFVDPLELSALVNSAEPILVPAINQMQVELLRSLQQGYCLTCIVAVVNDVNGHQTYQAMSAGATCVFNLAISVDKQIDMLHAVFATYTGAAEPPLRLASTEPTIQQESSADQTECMGEEGRLLISLLCGSHPISSIAKRFYCSERSMYRRVRQIYDFFGVSSRNELRSTVAVSQVGVQYAP